MLPIIDTHHHLWKTPLKWGVYVLEDLWLDTGSGKNGCHNIEKTVFIEYSVYLRRLPTSTMLMNLRGSRPSNPGMKWRISNGFD